MIEDRIGSCIRGKEYPKSMANRWRSRHHTRLKVCKYFAAEFFALPDKKKIKAYNALRDAMVRLSLDMQRTEAMMYARKKKYKNDVKREALRIDSTLAGETEKRKTAYMKEANGMRVERQVVLLRVEKICVEAERIVKLDRRKKAQLREALGNFNWQCNALVEMLRKDPERL
ncbi:MAG: hypothetical protein ACOYOS_00045 [Syntrophales bacterium]